MLPLQVHESKVDLSKKHDFFLQTKYTRKRKQQKLHNNLFEERLHEDPGHFLKITQGSFQRNARPSTV